MVSARQEGSSQKLQAQQTCPCSWVTDRDQDLPAGCPGREQAAGDTDTGGSPPWREVCGRKPVEGKVSKPQSHTPGCPAPLCHGPLSRQNKWSFAVKHCSPASLALAPAS